jgi:NSS family neurotransmitter:Na+ symporter
MVALLEVPVACLMNRAGWSRFRAVSVVAAVIFLLGLPSALGYGVLAGITLSGMALLDAIDHAVSNFLLPVSGLLIALLAGWHLNRSSMIAAAGMKGTVLGLLWIWSLRVLVPVTILLIIVRSLGLF